MPRCVSSSPRRWNRRRERWITRAPAATFNCTTRKLAAKENVFYGNAKETKVVERKVNRHARLRPAPGGSMGAVALEYLCRK